MNVRSGFGQLTLRNGIVYNGAFVNNQPQGEVAISFPDGAVYKGEVTRGVITGHGEMNGSDGVGYIGAFIDGKRNGNGTMYVVDGAYKLAYEFVNDEPKTFPNEV